MNKLKPNQRIEERIDPRTGEVDYIVTHLRPARSVRELTEIRPTDSLEAQQAIKEPIFEHRETHDLHGNVVGIYDPVDGSEPEPLDLPSEDVDLLFR